MEWEQFCRIKPISWQGRERVMGNSLSVMLSHCSSMVAIPNTAASLLCFPRVSSATAGCRVSHLTCSMSTIFLSSEGLIPDACCMVKPLKFSMMQKPLIWVSSFSSRFSKIMQ